MENESKVIDTLPPGKPLDTWIWEKVFNRKSPLDLDASMFGGVHTPFLHALAGSNDFSTSDLEAMFVVQAIVQGSESRSIEFHAAIVDHGKDGRKTWAQFFDASTGRELQARGETLAHAICLAALKYVGLGKDFDPENSIWVGRKVYAVRPDDPPYMEEGTITRWHENGSDVMVDFTPKDRPSYVSLVTRFALENGAVAFTPEKAVKGAYTRQFKVVRTAKKDVDQALTTLALIRALGNQ